VALEVLGRVGIEAARELGGREAGRDLIGSALSLDLAVAEEYDAAREPQRLLGRCSDRSDEPG
jgi:uncharacterized protein YjaG (DUF416 family)